MPSGGKVLRRTLTLSLAVAGIALLSACNVPRGAAQSAEVLRGATEEDASFAVVQVTRANADRVAGWPATGSGLRHGWISATRGPDSQILRTGDLVDLTIWDSQENSLFVSPAGRMTTLSGMKVSSSGTIFVPYLEQVVVRGLTPDQARSAIQTALAPIVPSAQVQLSAAAGRQNSVDLVSGVVAPRSVPLPDRNYTILSLIAEGGGIVPSFRNPVVRLIRDGKTYEIQAEELFSDGSKNTTLRGGDKVLVEEDRRYFTALGASGAEELVYFPKDRIAALEAVSLMGGLADSRANPKGVLVLREYPVSAVRLDGTGPEKPQVVFVFDLTSADGLFAARAFQINPGDTVLATESPVTTTRTIFGLLGSALGLARTAGEF